MDNNTRSPSAQKGSIKVIQKAPPRHREEVQISMKQIIQDAEDSLTATLFVSRGIAQEVFGPDVSTDVVLKVHALLLDEIHGDEEEPEEDTEEEETE